MNDAGVRTQTSGWRGRKLALRGTIAAGGAVALALGVSAPAMAAGGGNGGGAGTDLSADVLGTKLNANLGLGGLPTGNLPSVPTVPSVGSLPTLPALGGSGLLSTLNGVLGTVGTTVGTVDGVVNGLLSPLGLNPNLPTTNGGGSGGTGTGGTGGNGGPSGAPVQGGAGTQTGATATVGTPSGTSTLATALDGLAAVTAGSPNGLGLTIDAQSAQGAAAPLNTEVLANAAQTAGVADASGEMPWQIMLAAIGAVAVAAGANVYVIRKIKATS